MDKRKIWLVATLCAYALIPASAKSEEAEVICLAKNIYFEARGEEREGRYAVALVTLRRVEHNRFPNTVCEVVYQRNQFSWYWDGASDEPRDEEAWKEAQLVAKAVYMVYPELHDNTNGALFYKRYDTYSKYFLRLRHLTTIGQHEFFTYD